MLQKPSKQNNRKEECIGIRRESHLESGLFQFFPQLVTGVSVHRMKIFIMRGSQPLKGWYSRKEKSSRLEDSIHFPNSFSPRLDGHLTQHIKREDEVECPGGVGDLNDGGLTDFWDCLLYTSDAA